MFSALKLKPCSFSVLYKKVYQQDTSWPSCFRAVQYEATLTLGVLPIPYTLRLSLPFTGIAANLLFVEATEILTKWNVLLLKCFVAAVLHTDWLLCLKLYAEITMEQNESWICPPWSDVYSRNISQPQKRNFSWPQRTINAFIQTWRL